MGDNRIRFATTISQDLLKWLKVQAAKEGRNANDILEELIEKYKNEKGNN